MGPSWTLRSRIQRSVMYEKSDPGWLMTVATRSFLGRKGGEEQQRLKGVGGCGANEGGVLPFPELGPVSCSFYLGCGVFVSIYCFYFILLSNWKEFLNKFQYFFLKMRQRNCVYEIHLDFWVDFRFTFIIVSLVSWQIVHL